MARERYVLLGVGRPRADWFRRVGQWSTAAVIPAEFIRCVSTTEVRARLASGRAFSAILAEGGMTGVDREFVAIARDAGVPTVVVNQSGARDWVELGAAGALAPSFDREALLEALAVCATMVGTADDLPTASRPEGDPGHRGRVVTVIGGGGVGASTTAIAVAQGLAQSEPDRGVLLADLCRHADQAMLHDSGVVVPSVQELVEAHRHGRPSRDAVIGETFHIPARGYRLLLGLRQARQWVAIRPHAFESAFDSLQAAFDAVVCDVERDLDGEDGTGSVDVEERHVMARTAVMRSDVVVVVARADLQGLHTVVRLLADLMALGLDVARVLPVFTGAPRSPRERAQLARGLAELVGSSRRSSAAAEDLASPIFLPDKRQHLALRDGARLHDAAVDPVAGATRALLDRRPSPEPTAAPEPVRVTSSDIAGIRQDQP